MKECKHQQLIYKMGIGYEFGLAVICENCKKIMFDETDKFRAAYLGYTLEEWLKKHPHTK